MKIENTKQVEVLLQKESYRLSEIISLSKVLRHSMTSDYLKEKVDEDDISNVLKTIEMLSEKTFHQVMDLSEEVGRN